MKASTVAAILSFTASVLAAPVAPYYGSPENTLSSRSAVTDCGNTSDPDDCQGVVASIEGWDNSVNTVNTFLNEFRDEDLSGSDLTNAASTALSAALLEPHFLAKLRATPGLDATGTAAAATLDQFFGGIPADLTSISQGQGSASDLVNDINDRRCNHVLLAIGDLWISAAAAVGADTPGRPLGPEVCELNNGNVGDGFSSD